MGKIRGTHMASRNKSYITGNQIHRRNSRGLPRNSGWFRSCECRDDSRSRHIAPCFRDDTPGSPASFAAQLVAGLTLT